MATTIVIKNSAVAGKVPDASALVAAELALNLKDRKLYSKDADGNVFEIAGGEGANVPGGPTPPTNGNEIGDLFFDTTLNQLLYWDGSQWLPIAGNEVHNLDDLLDVEILNPAEGELLVWNGTNWENADPGYLTESEIINILNGLNPDGSPNPGNDGYLKPGDDVSELENDAGYLTEAEVINILEGNNPDGTDKPGGEEYAKLSDIGDGTITIVDAEGDPVGEFTVNQDGDTEITLPEIPVPEDQIHVGDTYPGTPTTGDLWVNTGECPPVLQIFDDCDDPGNPTWKPIGGGTTDGISFNAVILDDGTPEANTPGHILTAVAENITGGTSPNEYEYKWLVDGLTMGQNKTLNIINTFVGKIVTCDITVAEPDGSDPVTRTAVYSRVIEVAGSIVKPSIIAPADGAGEVVSAESDEIVSYVELDTDSGTGPGGIPNQTTSFDFDFGPYLISQGVTSITGFRLLDSGTNYSGLFEDIVIDGQSVITADRFVSQTGNVYQNNDTYSWETWFQSNAASYVQGENNDTSGYQCETQNMPLTNTCVITVRHYGTINERAIHVKDQNNRWLALFGAAIPQTIRTITLATDKDLAQFNPGDDVQQDSGHTPTTSVITGYSQETYPDLGAVGNWVGPAASSGANLFNKEPEGTHTGTYVYNSSNATPITWTAPLNGNVEEGSE